MTLLQFLDRLIPYDTFLDDLAARIVKLLKSDHDDPEFVSQRKAYQMFGRRNVERWRRQGKIVPCKRPGKVEYRTSELVFCNAPYKITLMTIRKTVVISEQNNKHFCIYSKCIKYRKHISMIKNNEGIETHM